MWCGVCSSWFARPQYYNAHLTGRKNTNCLRFQNKSSNPGSLGRLHVPLRKSPLINETHRPMHMPNKKTDRPLPLSIDKLTGKDVDGRIKHLLEKHRAVEEGYRDSRLLCNRCQAKEVIPATATMFCSNCHDDNVTHCQEVDIPEGEADEEIQLMDLGDEVEAVEDEAEDGVEGEVEGVKEDALAEEEAMADKRGSMLKDFKAYVEHAKKNFMALPRSIAVGVYLMKMLGDRGCSLSLYDEIMKWHVEFIDANNLLSREVLMKQLKTRYGTKDSEPFEKKCHLPFTEADIKVVCHDFLGQVRSSLADPRIKDEDYLFHNDDPFEGPPRDLEYVGDINTGRAFQETYDKLIAPKPFTSDGRKKVPLPLLFYQDGVVMGQLDNLPLEANKFCLGILTGKARDKSSSWRTLGYIPKYLKEKCTAKELIQDSNHVDAAAYLSDDESLPSLCNKDEEEEDEEEEEQIYAAVFNDNLLPDEGDSDNEIDEMFDFGHNEEEDEQDEISEMEPELPVCNAQDFHSMMDCILESVHGSQEAGIDWDLYYRGKLYRVCWIIYVIYVKCDTVEADKHCGSYNSRGKGVSQLCRYCCIPTEVTDEPYQDPEPDRKTMAMIQALIDERDAMGLKALSQQAIVNCWYKIRFALHNDYGIHGACPLEILHWLLIGQYKYARGMFFGQTGPESKLTVKINAIASQMGYLFGRQSDRDLPRTKFSKGIKKGKLMGHEMTGLMLVLAATLRPTKGRNNLLNESRGTQKLYFATKGHILDWLMFIETLLQMEAWLTQRQLPKASVERFGIKIKELMNMAKQIGKRTEKMGFKTFNFHAGVHLAEDIINFGVPIHVNTSANESHHKGDKRCARRTQRRPQKFDMQCAVRIQDMAVIELAMEDLKGRPPWKYYDGYDHTEEEAVLPVEGTLTGTKVVVKRVVDDEGAIRWTFKTLSKMRDVERFRYKQEVRDKLQAIAARHYPHFNEMHVFTEYVMPDKQIYRASPRYLGKPWNDWAMFDFTEDEELFNERRRQEKEKVTEGQKRIKSRKERSRQRRRRLRDSDDEDSSSSSCDSNDSNNNAIVDAWEDIAPPVDIRPAQILCFVDLRTLDGTDTAGHLPSGVYALVQSSDPVLDEEEVLMSELFTPFTKNLEVMVVPITSLLSPTCMIPDLSNEEDQSRYLNLFRRRDWASIFEAWLWEDHEQHFNEPQGLEAV